MKIRIHHSEQELLSNPKYIHYVDTMRAKLAKWGNSLAVRIPKDVIDNLRAEEGDDVIVEILKGSENGVEVDLETLPTFVDEDPNTSVHHDRYLYNRVTDENR